LSLRISPPEGFLVSRVIPAAWSALALTKLAWPLACPRTTGFSGETLLGGALAGGGGGGDAFAVGGGGGGPLRLVPAAADDPLAGFGLFRGARHLGDDVVPGLRFAEIEAHAELADACEMAVALDEAGDGRHAVEIDDAGLRADPFLNGGVGAECGDAIARDGDGLDDRCGGFECDDLAVAQDERGGLGEGGQRAENKQGKTHGDTHSI